ncbi:MAG: hypothetical protein RLZZ76_174, partial [Candidatus Parcubacteria bacterium]
MSKYYHIFLLLISLSFIGSTHYVHAEWLWAGNSTQNPGISATIDGTTYDTWTVGIDTNGTVVIGNWIAGGGGTSLTSGGGSPTNGGTPVPSIAACKFSATPSTVVEGSRRITLDWFNESAN